MPYRTNEPEEVHLGEPDLSGSYTARDYIKWSYEGLSELIRGRIFKMAAAPFPPHQIVSRKLLRKFYDFFPDNHKCQVFDAPTDVFLVKPGEDYRETRNVVQPDIFVLCDSAKITAKAIIGSPDLVVEILSPSNSQCDLKDKLEIYEEYRIPEYWIVDPENKSLIAYLLSEEGEYQPQKPKVPGDWLNSQEFPGLKIEVAEIFAGLPLDE